MSRGAVRFVMAAAGLAVMTGSALAQAPASAQRWEFAYVVDSTGAFAAGDTATAVGITLVARVAITDGSPNFGVSRVGGSNGVYFVNVTDPAGGPFFSSLGRGATGEGNDTNGNPLAGHYAAFRGSFSPQVGPDFVGSNTDTANGIFSQVGNVSRATAIVGSRALHNDGSAPGAATVVGSGLVGDFVQIYRFIFTPKVAQARTITLAWQNMTARYVFAVDGGGNATTASNFALPNGNINFRVPTPGAAALVGLGGLVAMRRRRA